MTISFQSRTHVSVLVGVLSGACICELLEWNLLLHQQFICNTLVFAFIFHDLSDRNHTGTFARWPKAPIVRAEKRGSAKVESNLTEFGLHAEREFRHLAHVVLMAETRPVRFEDLNTEQNVSSGRRTPLGFFNWVK